MYTKPYIFFFCICASIIGFAQLPKKPETDAESLISSLYRQNQGSDISYQDFYESLYQFYQNPIDLNTASSDELRGLFLLNDKQIADLKAHISTFGSLLSFYELQSIESFDLATIQSILSFVTITTEDRTWRGLKKELQNAHQHYLLFRQSIDLEKSKGYSKSNAYNGDPNQLYMRYRMQKYRCYSIGITAEKDAGEQLEISTKHKTFVADYLSFHAFVYDRGRIKKLALGDYQMQFGQGLILSGGFFIGKGSESILTIRRNSSGISPYTSTLETNYFRGTAITLDFKLIEITPFVSRKWIDGAIVSDSSYEDDLATLRNTGLHRTQTERDARKTVLETDYGINANYKSEAKNLQIGTTILQTEYDKIISSSDKLYNKFTFRGNQTTNASAYYSYFWRNISFFGEAGTSNGIGKGIVQGVLIAMGSKLDLSLLYRNFSPDLYTPHGNAFSENYKNANEEGFYWGLKFKLSPKTEFTAYYDSYQFPWLKYRISAPSVGHEYMINGRHKFNKKTIVSFQLRSESKEKDTYEEYFTDESFLAFHNRRYWMTQIESKVDKHFYFKSRVQYSSYEVVQKRTRGFLVLQDIGYDGRKIDLSFRTALFDSEDFENRQYTYEKDVLYAFNFPFYYGKGMRNYAIAKVNLSKQLTFWLKYGRTTYFDRQTVGSGNDQIMGNIRSEIRFQLRYSLL